MVSCIKYIWQHTFLTIFDPSQNDLLEYNGRHLLVAVIEYRAAELVAVDSFFSVLFKLDEGLGIAGLACGHWLESCRNSPETFLLTGVESLNVHMCSKFFANGPRCSDLFPKVLGSASHLVILVIYDPYIYTLW